MLLSAKRSILLLSESSTENSDMLDSKANRALLISAAARLRVPRLDPDRFVPAETLSEGRDQLVIAEPVTNDIVARAKETRQSFLVIDCLPEDQRPSFDTLEAKGTTGVTTEMVVFEWLERADSDDFRALLKQIR